jgi:hypothetical protein
MLHWGAYRVNSSVKFAASVKYTASLPALARSRSRGRSAALAELQGMPGGAWHTLNFSQAQADPQLKTYQTKTSPDAVDGELALLTHNRWTAPPSKVPGLFAGASSLKPHARSASQSPVLVD